MTRKILTLALLSFSTLPLMAVESISVKTDNVLQEVKIDRLLGGNVALWYTDEQLKSPEMDSHLAAWQPTLLRLPGGSWSDEIYWNGNGVRDGDKFDASKLTGGKWQVDYSDYAPGFRLSKTDGTLSDFHGHTDIRSLHEYVKSKSADAIVTVNAGTGTPEMAAEWVRFAKANQYPVAYWEIGNELDGEWELGHFQDNGKPMDASAYVSRYIAIAKAMRAVDPDAKIGGPTCSSDQLPFVEALIRDGGDLVDFVSFHTYPVLGGRVAEDKRMSAAEDVRKAVEKINTWIKKYQPDRVGEIEIGITEWHKQVMETSPTVDLSSGIWACLFIGSMAESGVDFANEWDFFSAVETGGHGLFDVSGKTPMAFFHAMTMWRDMGDKILATETNGSIRCFATKTDSTTELLIINPTRASRNFSLKIDDQKITGNLKAERFSQREYFWNTITGKAEWSTGSREIALTGEDTFPIGPMTALRVSISGNNGSEAKETTSAKPVLEILLPTSAPADLPIEGFVVIRDSETNNAFLGKIPEVKIEVQGAKTTSPTLDTSESVASFTLTADNPGQVTVKATTPDGLSDTHTFTLSPVRERKQIIWGFADEADVNSLETSYALTHDRAARPNQSVASVTLSDAKSISQKNTLLAINTIPDTFDPERIGGISGYLGASADLSCADPKAAVEIIVQSNLDHWIPVGEILLSDLRGNWKDAAIRFTDSATLDAMSEIYSLRLHLKTAQPVTGRIYVDDLGFILRATK